MLVRNQRRACGGVLTEHPILFSPDTKYFVCATSFHIKVFSVKTGETIQSFKAHKKRITSVFINPANAFQLYSCSEDGTVSAWDFLDKVLLNRFEVGNPIVACVISPSNDSMLHLVTRKMLDNSAKTNNVKYVVVSYSLQNQTLQELFELPSKPTSTLISPNNEILALICEDILLLWTFRESKLDRHQMQKPLTCMAFHPTDPILAVGDKIGRIHLVRLNQNSRFISSICHWHAHAVLSLCFTEDGAYLLSGGHEAVLVTWQLQTEKKEFLPRLPSAIRNISVSPDTKLYALCCDNNSILLINSLSSELHLKVQGLMFEGAVPPRLFVEPQNNHLVLNSKPGSLQFYNIFQDRHAFELKVAPLPPVAVKMRKKRVEVCVEHVSFSADGHWLATVARRLSALNFSDNSLKFWSYNFAEQNYDLNTHVNDPHDLAVTSLRFHPNQTLVFTSSKDKRLKLWELMDSAQNETSKESKGVSKGYWFCQAVWSFKDYLPLDSGFSADGSLLAIAANHVISLWDPFTLKLLNILSSSSPPEFVQKIAFIPKTPYLVATTRDRLVVWNLTSCSVWWSYIAKVNNFAVDPRGHYFAITFKGEKNEFLMLFHVSSPRPVKIWPLKRTGDVECPIVFIPTNSRPSDLVLISPHRKILFKSIHKEKSNNKENSVFSETKVKESVETSVFVQMYGKNLHSEKKNISEPSQQLIKDPSTNQNTNSKELFSTPSHIIPPLNKVFTSFMEDLLIKQNRKETHQTLGNESFVAISKSPLFSTSSQINKNEALSDQAKQIHLDKAVRTEFSKKKATHQFYQSMFDFLTEDLIEEENRLEKSTPKTKDNQFTNKGTPGRKNKETTTQEILQRVQPKKKQKNRTSVSNEGNTVGDSKHKGTNQNPESAASEVLMDDVDGIEAIENNEENKFITNGNCNSSTKHSFHTKEKSNHTPDKSTSKKPAQATETNHKKLKSNSFKHNQSFLSPKKRPANGLG